MSKSINNQASVKSPWVAFVGYIVLGVFVFVGLTVSGNMSAYTVILSGMTGAVFGGLYALHRCLLCPGLTVNGRCPNGKPDTYCPKSYLGTWRRRKEQRRARPHA